MGNGHENISEICIKVEDIILPMKMKAILILSPTRLKFYKKV